MRYRPRPDDQLMQDTVIFCVIMTFLLIIVIVFNGSSYDDSDECANIVRSHLSPYQITQMIESENLPTSYLEVKTWCSTGIDYETEIDNARNTFFEYPTRPDMIVD